MQEALFIGQQLVKLKEVDSTNTYALQMIRNREFMEGIVIIAGLQTGGRGQRGAEWMSESGKNITLSILLKPSFLGVTEQFDLTRAVALALAEVTEKFVSEKKILIKWPNDIYAGEKKTGGILIENIISGNVIASSVIGIGLNVNQEKFEGLPNATSFFIESGKSSAMEKVLAELFSCVEARYLHLRAGNEVLLREEYEKKLFGRGEQKRFTDFRKIFHAEIVHVTPEGKLVLRMENGEEKSFGFKEVGML
ncbi:MAG: biotin--[acetyl-CoA-carboxylase] ligase [Bacteroidetes bacterium]|nr:biotin--[acetyl-CoA-carboxylase] ligase [Bacteroidota bacterium]